MIQRSPVIFALLLAATLSVDAVAVYWLWTVPNGLSSQVLYSGLVYGQLSVCCIWALSAAGHTRGRWLLPYLVGLVAVLGTAPTIASRSRWSESAAYLWLYWTHVAVLLALLWLLKQTRVGWRLTGHVNSQRWRISTLQLLTITTIVAMTLALWVYADLREAAGLLVIAAWFGNSAGVGAAAVVTLSSPRALVIRTAMFAVAVCALWLAVCLGFWVAEPTGPESGAFLAQNLVQAIVLALWIELTPIIPRRTAIAADKAAPVSAEPSQAE